MKLIYCYIGKFRNIVNQEVCLSSDWDVHYVDSRLIIKRKERNCALEYLYGNHYMKDLYIIVGKTGSGKTNFLQLLGMDIYSRYDSEPNGDRYVMLYKMQGQNKFAAEIVGLDLSGLTDDLDCKQQRGYIQAIQFQYNPENGEFTDVTQLKPDDKENTCVVNAFDRNSFANCPYDDERKEGFYDNEELLPRMITQFGNSSASIECECLKEYLSQFSPNNVKRKSAFEIKWDNWQNKITLELSENLLRTDYWTYKSRAQEKRNRNFKKGKHHDGSTPKSRFIHDLLTDFAIYLRKWADTVDPEFPQYRGGLYNFGIKNPTELPDGKKNIHTQTN
jgi:hypothetical protein